MKYTPPKRTKDIGIKESQNYDVVNLSEHEKSLLYNEYTTLKDDTLKNYKDPISYRPVPTLDDYKSGKITRYIVQKRNDKSKLIEIDKQQAAYYGTPTGIDPTLYELLIFSWKISGKLNSEIDSNGIPILGIVDTNNNILAMITEQAPYIRLIIQTPVDLIKIS